MQTDFPDLTFDRKRAAAHAAHCRGCNCVFLWGKSLFGLTVYFANVSTVRETYIVVKSSRLSAQLSGIDGNVLVDATPSCWPRSKLKLAKLADFMLFMASTTLVMRLCDYAVCDHW
jgi:hypothetical protein